MRRAQKTEPRNIIASERALEALEMRKAHMGYKEIGQALGISTASAWKRVRSALRGLKAVTDEKAEDVIELELQRLDKMAAGLWDRVCRISKKNENGTEEIRNSELAAIDRMLRIMERRASLLGLDAPKRQEVTGKDGTPLSDTRAELDSTLTRLAAAIEAARDPGPIE